MKSCKSYLTLILLPLFILAACSADITPAQTQPSTDVSVDAYRLNVNRIFGYGGMGNDIKGRFALSVAGDQERIDSVTYLIDGEAMLPVITQPPFESAFETTDYTPGHHALSARVVLADGSVMETERRGYDFVTAEQEQAAIREIIIPLVTVVLAVSLVGIAFQMLVTRKRPATSLEPGAPRQYGISGGAVCPKCRRPFALRVFSPHLLMFKFERCTNCGKWVLVRRASEDELRGAEEAEMRDAQAAIPHEGQVEEKKEKDKIDDSRYIE